MKAGFKISTLLFSSLVFYSVPQRCEASVIGQLCSSVTSFLNDEAAKADAEAKACKDKCGWKKRKDDLINAARKKAKESCSKGEAPDVTELSKGLDRNTKDRLKDVYNRNSRMFDGKAKLDAANFGAVSSKDTAITGKGGNVTDLKSSEPAVPKIDSATEFSLTGKSNSLFASASPAKPEVDTVPATSAKPSAATQKAGAAAAPAAAGGVVIPELPALDIPAIPDIPDPAWFEYRKDYCTVARSLPALLDAQKAKLSETIDKFKAAYAQIDPTIFPPATQEELKSKYIKIILDAGNIQTKLTLAKISIQNDIASYCSGGSSEKTGWTEKLGNKWHKWREHEKCGEGWYNPNKECCVDRAKVSQQSCEAKVIAINGPSELILSKPAENSKPITLSFRGAPGEACSCPKTKTIQWSLPSEKAEFAGAVNKATAKVRAASESHDPQDVSVTVTVDGVTSAPKKLTVRRPERLSHPGLVAETGQGKEGITIFTAFQWNLVDQLGKPLAAAPVNLTVKKTAGTTLLDWEDISYSKITDINGQFPDRYSIVTENKWITTGQLNVTLGQTLIVAGWPGTSQVNITVAPGAYIQIAGETPVELLPLP